MERLVPGPQWRCRGWPSARRSALTGGNLQPGRRATCWWNVDHTVAQRRPGESRLPGTVSECHCAYHDQCEWAFPPDYLLSLQLGFAICARQGTECRGRGADLRGRENESRFVH